MDVISRMNYVCRFVYNLMTSMFDIKEVLPHNDSSQIECYNWKTVTPRDFGIIVDPKRFGYRRRDKVTQRTFVIPTKRDSSGRLVSTTFRLFGSKNRLIHPSREGKRSRMKVGSSDGEVPKNSRTQYHQNKITSPLSHNTDRDDVAQFVILIQVEWCYS